MGPVSYALVPTNSLLIMKSGYEGPALLSPFPEDLLKSKQLW